MSNNNASYEQELWSQVLPLLKKSVAAPSYNGFLAELQPVAIKDNDFVLQTSSSFNLITLRDRYSVTISNILFEISSNHYNVVFILPFEREQYIVKPDVQDESAINPKYTFDNYVIGSSNRFAHAAASAVAINPGKRYNPLFIYGGVGLGKTHLMHAIGNEMLAQNPNYSIMYVTSEKFTNELISAIRSDKNEEFRTKYRNVDVLMIDDIQFISNKEGTQEEFFHTFNTLHGKQKQIVISSDKQPKQIPTLEERLRSRFEWGLIADIQPPDHETRVAILQKKALAENLDVPEDILHFIATKVESNIRQLEGTLTRVIAYCSLHSESLSMDVAARALSDFYPDGGKRIINVDYVKEIVSNYFNITIEDFSSKKRNREISLPRQIAMYLCRENIDISLPKIGEAFGGRDHTTVMHACEKISIDMRASQEFAEQIKDLTNRLKAPM